jgi:hypothetical protein
MQGQTGPSGQDPAALKRATVGASVLSFALVLGAWGAIAESNEGRDRVDVVAAAEEVPLDVAIDPVEAAPATTAATRAKKVVQAVPAAALFRSPTCAAPAKAADVAPAKAVKAAGAEIAVLGEDYPDVYAGHLGCRSAGRLVVYRVPDGTFDDAAREIAERENVALQLVKAPYSRQQLVDRTEWITERREKWSAAGIVIRSIANKPNGTLEVAVDPAKVPAAAKRLGKHKAQVRVVPHGS